VQEHHHTTSPPRFEASMLAARIDRCACNRFAGRTPKWIGIVHLSCLVKYIIKIGIAGLPGGTCPVIFRRRLRVNRWNFTSVESIPRSALEN
jgi:hypothetical protein